jgi:hypothetical protein
MTIDTTTDRVLAVDYSMSLEDMIAAGKYDWVSGGITAERFPVEGTGIKKFRTKLFDFSPRISSDDAAAAIRKENFTPGNDVHGFAFGATFPDEQRKYPIACLGLSAQVRGGRGVVCLSRYGVERSLSLYDWGDRWDDDWRFLAVQEVSGA